MTHQSSAPALWLQVRFEDASHVFEFSPDNDRAIVVGSLLRADIRIDEPGIAPVHFHFERDGYLVHLVPAYGANLRVEGVPITAPYAIRQQALVHFRRHRMHVAVLERPPRGFMGKAIVAADQVTPDEDLGDYGDRTVVTMRPIDEAQICEPAPHSHRTVSPLLLGHVLAPRVHAAPGAAPLLPCTSCNASAGQKACEVLRARCFVPDAPDNLNWTGAPTKAPTHGLEDHCHGVRRRNGTGDIRGVVAKPSTRLALSAPVELTKRESKNELR